jgi:hypothetical protein
MCSLLVFRVRTFVYWRSSSKVLQSDEVQSLLAKLGPSNGNSDDEGVERLHVRSSNLDKNIAIAMFLKYFRSRKLSWSNSGCQEPDYCDMESPTRAPEASTRRANRLKPRSDVGDSRGGDSKRRDIEESQIDRPCTLPGRPRRKARRPANEP